MLGDAVFRASAMIAAMNASAIHDLLEDGLFGDVSVSEPVSKPVRLSAPSTRLRPSALAA